MSKVLECLRFGVYGMKTKTSMYTYDLRLIYNVLSLEGFRTCILK